MNITIPTTHGGTDSEETEIDRQAEIQVKESEKVTEKSPHQPEANRIADKKKKGNLSYWRGFSKMQVVRNARNKLEMLKVWQTGALDNLCESKFPNRASRLEEETEDARS